MRWSRSVWAATLILAMLLGVRAHGAEARTKEPSKPSAQAEKTATAGDVAKLVEQLDARRFADRQAASDKLAAVGKPAIPALAKAAQGESAEASARALELLGKFLDWPEEGTSAAARAALDEIAKGPRPAAARRAEELLRQHQQDRFARQFEGRMFGGGIQFGGANAVRISVKNVNGVRDTDVNENQKKIKIHDDPRNKIKVEITTKQNGKDKTDAYEAANVEELKKKHPEAYKVYKQYAENQGLGGVIQFQVQMGGVPFPVPVPAPVPGAAETRLVEVAATILRNARTHLETLPKGDQLKQATQESREELRKRVQELQQHLADLQKQLQDKADPKAEKSKPAADKAPAK